MIKKLGLLVSFLICMSTSSFAINLELTQGLRQALPIALVPFKNHFSDASKLISKIITQDLKNSGRFRFVDFDFKAHHPANALETNFPYWKRIGANNLIVGDIAPMERDKLSVAFQLLDPVGRAHIIVSREYKIDSKDARALAHHISDTIYQQLTGQKGIFSTRIAYVVVSRKANRPPRYALEIADYDGFDPKKLLVSSEPIMSPAWSPDAKKIAYVSFENKRSQIFIVDVRTGKRQLLTSFPGINGAPAWSPSGDKIAFVLSKSGSPKIYIYDLIHHHLAKVTSGISIDTEPSFSPDGQKLIFTSGRGGSPQIYSLDLNSKKISRLTFSGNYNASASFTPDSKHIVLLHRVGHRYVIASQSLNSGRVTQLTFSKFDESPSVAPNGKMILYATRQQGRGVIKIVSTDGQINLKLPHTGGHVQEPAWSPFVT